MGLANVRYVPQPLPLSTTAQVRNDLGILGTPGPPRRELDGSIAINSTMVRPSMGVGTALFHIDGLIHTVGSLVPPPLLLLSMDMAEELRQLRAQV